MEDTVVFLTWKVVISVSFSIAFDKQVLVIRKSVNGLKKQKQCCLIHNWVPLCIGHCHLCLKIRFQKTDILSPAVTVPPSFWKTVPSFENRYIITCSNGSSVLLENCSKFWKLFKIYFSELFVLCHVGWGFATFPFNLNLDQFILEQGHFHYFIVSHQINIVSRISWIF